MALKNFVMVDPDDLQFARQINDTTWQYCQVNDSKEIGRRLKEKYQSEPYRLLEDFSEHDIESPFLFYNETINFNDISDLDVLDISNEYGLKEQNLSESEFIQLVIEGYFEQYFTIGY